jgi:hypothetical protein
VITTKRDEMRTIAANTMNPIKDPGRVERYGSLLREMMLTRPGDECEFNPDWIRSHGWKVVPVESMARLPVPDIPRIVSALNGAGFTQCLAIFNEEGYIQRLPVVVVASDPPRDMATCYDLSVDEADFREFNRELGPFRSVLTTDDRAWAISCNEWYNLFAGKPELLEAMLGKSIEQARQEYLQFASALSKSPDEPLLLVAKQYATL